MKNTRLVRTFTASLLSLAMLLSVTLLSELAAPASAYQVQYGYAAEALWEEGLFLGDGTSFALDKPLTRAAGVTMLVRLLGKEAEAAAGEYETPFSDLPGWARGCVGYAYTRGLTNGTGATTFSPNDEMNAAQFLTLVLRALGYNDRAGDFSYDRAAAKALEVGLIGESCYRQYTTTKAFLRDNAAVIAYNALWLTKKGTDTILHATITVPGRPLGAMPAHTSAQANKTVEYPYLDADGYWHYQIKLNGELLGLKNDALLSTENNEYNELLYPVSEILEYFGVAYYWDRSTDDFTTVVNGVKASRDCADGSYMWFSSQTDGYGNSIKPGSVNGVFYAPNFFFEHTLGATLSKIAKGAEKAQGYVDITVSKSYAWGTGSTTVPVMRWDGDCYTADGSGTGGNAGGGTGYELCSACSGTGMVRCVSCMGVGQIMTSRPVYNPISKIYEQKQVFSDCPYCTGGNTICSACGGTGHR